MTLRQISNATKISVGQLEALERSDLSRLPGGIFSRAFVRSYAVEVGLDPEATINEFVAQFPRDESVTAGHPATDHVEDREGIESDQRMASTVLRLVLVSVPLAALVLYWSATGGWRPTAQPEDALPAPTREARPDTSEPAPPARAESVAQGVPVAATERPAGVAADAAPASVGQLTVTILAVRPCWISAVADGQQVIARLFATGERDVVLVRRELVLTAGDASAITMTVNGRPARGLGGSGEVVTARVTPENFTDYLARP